MNTMIQRSRLAAVVATCVGLLLAVPGRGNERASTSSWRDDPAWHDGPAEWTEYEAHRSIYGVDRSYDATIFTNKQRMDPRTTTKASDWRAPDTIEVFKHNVSEMIPTEHYTYRFLTTCFVRTDTLEVFKLAASTQEDCGTTSHEFVVRDGRVEANESCYFPGTGRVSSTFDAPSGLMFHDALSLRLRDYPFDDAAHPQWTVTLVPDQTDTHAVSPRPASATVSYVGRERIRVPYGEVDCHHLRVSHAPDGGVGSSDYWFAADRALLHVMVRYEGPYGVRYALKHRGWWAYWDRTQPRPN
ncbi:MAG: hypothetical protein KDA25_03495 [Phycisphaerales bacterium]|nr:hypothetical protein [Phycisphaerales bacterium]